MPLSSEGRSLAPPASRKRTHAEITRSSSRSVTPAVPSKRRRISRTSMSHHHNYPTAHVRTERHGFDLRRPAMASSSTTVPDTIDLTLDEDDEHYAETAFREFSPASSIRFDYGPSVRSTPYSPFPDEVIERERPPNPRPQTEPAGIEVIDLLDEEDNVPIAQTRRRRDSTSSEVEFVRERPAPNRPAQPNAPHDHIRPAQPRRVPSFPNGIASIPELLRRGTQYMFGGMNAVERRQGLRDFLAQPRPMVNVPVAPNQRPAAGIEVGDDLEGLNFDYAAQGFAMGGDRSSEGPQIIRDPYKAPPPVKDGFTRTFGEEEILVCPLCNEELSTGKKAEDQRVWVVKQCGHVYCGRCATRRSVMQSKTKDRKARKDQPVMKFTKCIIDGCGKPVTAKAAMIPVYLGGE